MRRFYMPLLFGALCCWIYSCKKGPKNVEVNSTLEAYPTMIVGKWIPIKDHVKAYSSDGSVFVKDTTLTLTNDVNDPAWEDIYNKDGSNYRVFFEGNSTALSADTASKNTYSISGDNLLLYQQGSSVAFPDPILLLNATDMELESTTVTVFVPANFNLPPNETYKIIEDISYKKQ